MEVSVGPTQALVSVLQQRNQTAPLPVRVMAMIDTGASCTVISATLAHEVARADAGGGDQLPGKGLQAVFARREVVPYAG